MLNNLIKMFLIDLKMNGCSEQTFKSYRYYFKRFISFIEENNIDFTKLNVSQVKMFRNQLVELGLKPRTVNKYLSVLKSFYDFLVEEEEVNVNPIITRRLRVKEGQLLPKFLTPSELEKVKDWFSTLPEHVSLGFRTMLATGMRVGEVSAITPQDIIKLDNGGYIIRVRHGKGNKERYVPIMDAEVAKDIINFLGDRNEDEPIFKIKAKSFVDWAQKCKLVTGVDFHTHRCRHTVGTQLLQKGVSLDKVQEVLGHENISTTRRYAKTAPEAVLELAAKTDKLKETGAIYRYWLP